jgi:hypothetical protein
LVLGSESIKKYKRDCPVTKECNCFVWDLVAFCTVQ